MLRNAISTLLLILASLAAPYVAAADSCQLPFDALTKTVTTPSHSYANYTTNGKQTTTEIIYTQGKTFMRANGKWMNNPEGPKEVLDQIAEDRKHATTTCQVVREESVNGQPATVYTVHTKTEDSTSDGQMWIAKGTGLLLRQETDIDVGGGHLGKSHLSVRYEYDNVRPPM
jgi:outer membrane lipoprotein-sorting protein